MFYEQLKPSKVISHCKPVLKYTHQFCQQILVKPVLLDGSLLFHTSSMLSSNCLLFPYFLTKLSKQNKNNCTRRAILLQRKFWFKVM